MKISKLFQRDIPQAEFDAGAWQHVRRFESNGEESDFAVLHDGDYATRWNTGGYKVPGDYMLFAFDTAVDYDYISFVETQSVYDYPVDLRVSTSLDGMVWTDQTIHSPIPADYQFALRPEPYRFLKLVNQDRSENTWYWWTVAEMHFGHAKR
jgi:hypothetical protein